MTVSNTSLLMTNPDFLNIKESFKNYLLGQDQFKDYNYEGSNWAVVLELLAYNTYQSAFLDNMVASEMFLDTCQLMSSAISHAKVLNYIPRSTRSAVSSVDLQIIPPDDPGTIVIPASYAFSSQIGSATYTFLTESAILVTNNNGNYIANNIPIKEGFQVTEFFTIDGTDTQKLLLSNPTVDTTTIQVSVSNGGPQTLYTPATSIVGLTSTSQVYFIEQDYSELYQIVFGDGVFGVAQPTNTLVRVTYQVSSGTGPNGANLFVPVGTISGYNNLIVTTVTVAEGGSDPETIESIKQNAPLTYQTKGRAVTDSDYKVLLKTNFPEIISLNVYGGENASPPQYGKVIICLNIAGTNSVPQTNIDRYTNYLNSINSTIITPVFVSATNLYIKVNSLVYYDYTQTSLTAGDIESAVIATIQNYNSTYLNMFDTTFKSSKFGTAIDSSDSSIDSNATDIQLVSYIGLDNLAQISQTIQFENPLDLNEADVVSSNVFTYQGKVCTLTAINGKVYIQTSTNNISNLLAQVGTVDYTSGIVILFAFQIDSVVGANLQVYVRPLNKNVTVALNNILDIDFNLLSVKAVPLQE